MRAFKNTIHSKEKGIALKSLYNPIDLAQKNQHPKQRKMISRLLLEKSLTPGRADLPCIKITIKASINRSPKILARTEGL